MEDQALFSVMAKCFGPVDKDEWDELTSAPLWQSFLDAARSILQDDRLLGEPSSLAFETRRRSSLYEFLSRSEVDSLFRPPTYEEKQLFAARHFTGGLPESAMPVESLYDSRSAGSCGAAHDAPYGTPYSAPQNRNSHNANSYSGFYMGDSARYMSELTKCMGLEIPHEFSAYPDHLAIELDLMSVLLRTGQIAQAQTFLAERFGWITAYRMDLLHIGDEASFYVGLIDVLIGLREQQLEQQLNQPLEQMQSETMQNQAS